MADGESFDRAPAPRRGGGGGGGGLMAEIKRVPLWVWPIAGIVVFFVVRAFLSNRASSTAAATDTSGSASSGSGATGDATSGDQNGVPGSNPDVPSGAVPQPINAPNPDQGFIRQPTAVNVPNPDQGFINNPSSRQPPPTPPPSPSPKPPTPAPKPSTTHVVQSGETLNEIAQHYGVSEPQLYTSNSSVIESTARAHGMASSNDGWWIFPGERLTIP